MAGKGGKRENAGRKKGSPNKAKRELQELINDSVVNKCLTNLEILANGVVLQKEDKKGNTKIYTAAPDYFANAYLLDQKFGKARQRQEITGKDGEKFEMVISDYRGQ